VNLIVISSFLKMSRLIKIYKYGFAASFIGYSYITIPKVINDYNGGYNTNYDLIDSTLKIFSLSFAGALIWPLSIPVVTIIKYKYKQY